MGTATSEVDAVEEKSRKFFSHRSGDPGSDELHTPAKNITKEMSVLNKTCDGHLVVPSRSRKNPHSDRMSSITMKSFAYATA